MQISAVRKMLKAKIKADYESQAAYARCIDISYNNLSLFLSGSGSYKNRVPKKILDDLGLKREVSIDYKKKIIIQELK